MLNLQTFTVSHLITHAGRGVYPYLPMATNAPWSIFWGGWTKSYLSMYLVYIVFLSFSQKNFLLATLARLRFILNLQMQCFTNPIYIYIYIFFFHFLVSLSLTACFQSSLKKRIKWHKIAYKMSKNCLWGWGGWGWGVAKKGGVVRMGGAPWLLGDRRPCMQVSWTI